MDNILGRPFNKKQDVNKYNKNTTINTNKHYKTIDGVKHEPFEEITIDVDAAYTGPVIEKLGGRKGKMLSMDQMDGGLTRLIYHIPTRGLLGYRSEFMTDTRGMGMMSYVFHEYAPFAGDIRNRNNGALYAMEQGQSLAFPLANLQGRGTLFMGPGAKFYIGQIIGEHNRKNDLPVNPARGKKLSNMRSSGADESVVLIPHRIMDLEDCIDWINDDEIVEVTPKAIRMRKMNASLKIKGNKGNGPK